MRTTRAFLIVLCVVSLAHPERADSAADALPPRLQTTGMPLRTWIDSSGKSLSFEDYAKSTTAALRKYRWKIPGEPDTTRSNRIALVAPTQWPQRRGCDSHNTEGVLLVHGLTDSPYWMRDLGQFFSDFPQCMLVRSILLPGHASAPGDLSKVKLNDWLEAVRYGIQSFDKQATSVHVAGYSTGGALAIYWAYHQANLPVPIRSLLLFSPAIQPKGFLSRLKVLPRIVGKVSEVTGIGAWPRVHADQDFAKYESFALNAQYQIYLLDQELKKYIESPLDVPTFLALSRDDATIDAVDSIRFFLDSTTNVSRMILVASDATEHHVARAAADPRVKVLPARIPLLRIMGFAHTSLVLTSSDPHYGIDGDYADCLAYADKVKVELSAKYCACITPQMFAPHCRQKGSGNYVFGERDKASAAAYVLRRMTFNPYFTEMTNDITKFLTELPKR